MKNQLSSFVFILVTISLFFTSCEDSINDLVGTWDYTQVSFTNCTDATANGNFDYTGDGDCEVINSITTCTQLSLEMDETNYMIRETVTTDGNEVSSILDEGTYTITPNGVVGPSIQFCTDLVCRSEAYLVSGNTLTLEFNDVNTGCNRIITATK